jgi:prolyl-tRNA synthetase
LESNGFEVLYDDRDESPGVKFNDADLIGIPLRLTVSERSLKGGGVELKLRRGTQPAIVPLNEVSQRVKAEISILEMEIANKVEQVAYNA